MANTADPRAVDERAIAQRDEIIRILTRILELADPDGDEP